MPELRSRVRPGPGGVGDGLPMDASGSPLLARWFVIAMLVLVPAAIGATVWALTSISRPVIDAAARRPPGDADVTHARGDATLNRIRVGEPGPGCAAGVTLVGDEPARTVLRSALGATCQLLQRPDLADAAAGLERWAEADGRARLAVFELTGVESSARLDDGALVIELNARFQLQQGVAAAPSLVHELTHLAHGMPGDAVTAEAELAALRAEDLACERLVFDGPPPRSCADAAEVLAGADPLASLTAAGYPREGQR